MNIGLYVWVFLAMLRVAPPEQHERAPWADESPAAALARYGDIAAAITNVCSGAKAERSCAALLVAIGAGESGYARDADQGPCYRKGGYRTRCDSGAAASIWQNHAYGVDRDKRPITIERLFAERELAAWQTLRIARGSLTQCRHLEPRDRLAGLGNGFCKPSASARARYDLWRRVESF